jgi:hypothetical protein
VRRPLLQRFPLFIQILVSIVRPGNSVLGVSQHSFRDVRRHLQPGEASTARPAQVMQRETTDTLLGRRQLDLPV